MRYALFLPIFDELADPVVVARLSAEAEEAGWDGVFVWDHLVYRAPVREVADPWITMAAMAAATEQIRLGPMVTPLPRRRPAKVARETATLDRLSGGRLTLGVGIGGDDSGELTGTGEPLDDRLRAGRLDESLEVVQAAWSGEPVHHRGEHYVVDGLTFRPTPVQQVDGRPAVPVWVAVRYGNTRPLRRAARHQGVFPVNLDRPDQLAEIVAAVGQHRAAAARAARIDGGLDGGVGGGIDVALEGGYELLVEGGLDAGYEVAAEGPPGADPAPFGAVGATWWLVSFDWRAVSVDQVRGVLRDGPPA